MFKLDPISWICVCSHDPQLHESCCIFVSEAQAAQFRVQHHKKSWRTSSLRILQNLSFSKSWRICFILFPSHCLHQLFKGQSPAFCSRLCSIFILGQVLLWLVCASSQVPAFGSMKKQCFKRPNLKQLTDSGNLAGKKKTCLPKTPPPAQHVTASVGTDHEADKAIGFLEAAPALVQLHLHLMAFTKITNPRQARESNLDIAEVKHFQEKLGKFIKITKIEGS